MPRDMIAMFLCKSPSQTNTAVWTKCKDCVQLLGVVTNILAHRAASIFSRTIYLCEFPNIRLRKTEFLQRRKNISVRTTHYALL
jgi:hypothetical protein